MELGEAVGFAAGFGVVACWAAFAWEGLHVVATEVVDFSNTFAHSVWVFVCVFGRYLDSLKALPESLDRGFCSGHFDSSRYDGGSKA